MKNIFGLILAILAGVFLVWISLQGASKPSQEIDSDMNLATLVAAPQNFAKAQAVDINELPFLDNPDIYQFDDPATIVTMYVTVMIGNATDRTNSTWREVNDFTKWFNDTRLIVDPPRTEAILQIGDENGPLPGEIGYGEIVPNATIQIRGASTSTAPQKSYKIELRSRAGEWRGQTTIALNKHHWDITRVRNKLNFDLMKDIPNLVSLRTQFVHLYIKDETSDPPSEKFVDYGLFTQVEQPNRKYLRNHLLDSDGQLYKMNFFEFYRYPENIRLVDDPLYDETAFSTILEAKGNKNHNKLIQMLEDVNNANLPIEQTFDKYFDAENYFTWMAYNILVGNVDTQSQNYYLYSPKNGQRWYFIGWDYDGSFYRLTREELGYTPYEPWETGVANYWGGVLHNRVLRVEKYRNLLDDKINELRIFLNADQIESLLRSYKQITEHHIFSMPDLYYLPGERANYVKQYSIIPLDVERNYVLYKESLLKPMPFYLGSPKVVGSALVFNWDEAYNFRPQNTEYHFALSTDWMFSQIVYETTISNLLSVSVDMPKPGMYFWRVTATNEDGYSQYPFDYYMDAERVQRPGMKYLYISPDGQVLEE